DRLDADVGAEAAGDAADELDGVAAAGIERVGGAELLGELQLAVVEIDGHDRRRAREVRPGDGGVADAAAPEDRDALAAGDTASVDGRADAGHHPAAEQAGGGGRRLRVDLGALARSDEGLVGEGADA